MTVRRKLTGTAIAAAAVVAAAVALYPAGSQASNPHDVAWTSIPAHPDTRGIAVPNAVSPELRQYIVAQGSAKLENPDGVVGYYGYNANGTLVPDPTVIQAPGHNVEANKTEPDKNTYLNMSGLTGADPNYDYGTHFLYAGHETGVHGYVTRINLDADAAHRVTLIADTMTDGSAVPTIDGSTWDPWAKKLLFTTESPNNASVLQTGADVGSVGQDISAQLGRGGYEGIQNDSAGNLWLVEDVGGTTVNGARNPNSFVFRFVPNDPTDLTKGGKLQALQVISARTHTPITFQAVDAAHPNGSIFSDDMADLTNYGTTLATNWVTIHDTAVDTSGLPFLANTLAKAAGATPFKRPENGVFRPGTKFREFFFDATGDTNANSPANAGFGGWGTIYKLVQADPRSDHGTLRVFYEGDGVRAAFDNVTFVDREHIAFVEDAGDGLHLQRNALDSAYLFDTRTDYSNGVAQPVRFIAEGRDAAATEDNMLGALGNGFNNDGDNEITGIHMSDGDPSIGGILGAKDPQLFEDGWRLFWNQQHGDNVAWEITPAA